MTTPKALFVALVALAIAQAIFYYPQLPDTVASHFDGAGHPNGWSSKAEFFGVMFGMILVLGVVFLGITRAISRVPVSWISLPYRDYWLSEERRAETMRFVDNRISWLGVGTMLLILATIQFTIDANLRHHQELPARFLWVFWAYIAYSTGWTLHFLLHFVRVRKRQNAV